MKIIGVIKQKERYIVEITADEIANIMGYDSAYSNKTELEINTSIPIQKQYGDIQLLKNLYKDSIKLKKETVEFENRVNRVVEFAEKLNFNN